MAFAPGTRVRGWVRTFKGTWGFLNSESFQGDVFVGLKSNPHIQSLRENDQVEFEIKTEASGKQVAVNVAIAGGNQAMGMSGGDGQRYTGVVRSFKATWGFIRSDSYNGDLFVGLKSNQHLQGALVAEDQVSFDIKQQENGKPEAVNVQVVNNKVSNAAPAGPVGPVVRANVGHLLGNSMFGRIRNIRDTWGFVNSDAFTGDLFIHLNGNKALGHCSAGDPIQFEIAEDPKLAGNFTAINAVPVKDNVKNFIGETLRGYVKSFSGTWGFINSNRFEEDLFVGVKQNPQLRPGLVQGEAVEFQVARDEKSRNGTTAVRVQRLDAGPAGVPAGHGVQMQQFRPQQMMQQMQHFVQQYAPPPQPPRRGMNGSQRGGGARSSGMSAAALVGRQCTGQVRKFAEPFGFITSSQFEGDLFVGSKGNAHLSAPLQEGDNVQFVVSHDGPKPEAVSVRIMGHGGAQPQFMGGRDRSRSPAPSQFMGVAPAPTRAPQGNRAGGRAGGQGANLGHLVGKLVTGWVKSFQGKWGFVNSDCFEGDLFVGANANKHLGRELQQGEQVQFLVSVGPGGKFEAMNVQPA